MYESFYGLKENPFSLTPDPNYIYLGENHREALAQLIYGVRQKKGFIVLTGEVGTGKTTIIRCFLETLNGRHNSTKAALLFNPKLPVNDFLQYILRDFGLAIQSGTSKGEYLHTLYEYLIEAYQKDEKVVLIVDEAQGLSPDLLEEIRLLSNLETSKAKLLQIVLVGQPELGKTLRQPDFRQLRQRINLQHHLPPLKEDETGEYIERRMRIAGSKKSPFTKKAVKEIYRKSAGIPRLINILCDNALLTGYASDKKIIDEKIVREVAKDVKLEGQKPFKRFRLFSALLLIGGAGSFLLLQGTGILAAVIQSLKEIIHNQFQTILTFFK